MRIEKFTPLEKTRFLRRQGSLAGFTLLEIILVVVIVAVAAGVMVPRVGTALARWKLNQEAITYIRWLQTIRAEAIKTGKTHEIRKVGTNHYRIYRVEGSRRIYLGEERVDPGIRFGMSYGLVTVDSFGSDPLTQNNVRFQIPLAPSYCYVSIVLTGAKISDYRRCY